MDVTVLDYSKVLRDFQYKPNWAYHAYEYEGRWYLRVVMLVENSRAPWHRWEIKPAPQDQMYSDISLMFRNFRPQEFAGYSPSREVVEVMGTFEILPPFGTYDETTFVNWLVDTIKSMEDHETDEWIRYKGELLNDPHKE